MTYYQREALKKMEPGIWYHWMPDGGELKELVEQGILEAKEFQDSEGEIRFTYRKARNEKTS